MKLSFESEQAVVSLESIDDDAEFLKLFIEDKEKGDTLEVEVSMLFMFATVNAFNLIRSKKIGH